MAPTLDVLVLFFQILTLVDLRCLRCSIYKIFITGIFQKPTSNAIEYANQIDVTNGSTAVSLSNYSFVTAVPTLQVKLGESLKRKVPKIGKDATVLNF